METFVLVVCNIILFLPIIVLIGYGIMHICQKISYKTTDKKINQFWANTLNISEKEVKKILSNREHSESLCIFEPPTCKEESNPPCQNSSVSPFTEVYKRYYHEIIKLPIVKQCENYKPLTAAFLYLITDVTDSKKSTEYREKISREIFDFLEKKIISTSELEIFDMAFEIMIRVVRGELEPRGDWCFHYPEKGGLMGVFQCYGDLMRCPDYLYDYETAKIMIFSAEDMKNFAFEFGKVLESMLDFFQELDNILKSEDESPNENVTDISENPEADINEMWKTVLYFWSWTKDDKKYQKVKSMKYKVISFTKQNRPMIDTIKSNSSDTTDADVRAFFVILQGLVYSYYLVMDYENYFRSYNVFDVTMAMMEVFVKNHYIRGTDFTQEDIDIMIQDDAIIKSKTLEKLKQLNQS